MGHWPGHAKPPMNITDLRPNPKNPRKISAQRDARLAEYLAEFGDLSGLIFNRDGTVISAHQRVRHYKRNGGQLVLVEQYDEPTKDGTIARGHIEMPDGTRYIVRQVDWEKEKAERAMIVANGSFGEWDTEVLLGHFDFDISELIEFGVPETIFVDSKKDAPRETVEDDYEIPDVIKTDIKRGDLFEIGQHRLLCGDSTDPDDVAKLMNGELADLIFTDPPYGVSFTGAANPTAKVWKMIKNDALRGDGLTQFLTLAFDNALQYSKPDVAAYVFYASKTHVQFETAINAAGWEVSQQLIWVKGMVMARSDYHWAHEPMLYCRKAGQKKPWHGDRTQTTVMGYKKSDLTQMRKEDLIQIVKNLQDTSSVWEIRKDAVTTYKHPTQKPVHLPGRAMGNSSKEGDITVDLFGGSGTTMVAGEQLGRRVYMMELDKLFCQAIVDRMLALNSQIKVKKNGKPYKKTSKEFC